MLIKYDLLVYLGFCGAFGITFFAVKVMRVPVNADMETRKIRVAAATLIGIFSILLLVIIFYFAAPDESTKESTKLIFDKTITALTPIVGTIIGYITSLGNKDKPNQPDTTSSVSAESKSEKPNTHG